MWPRGDRRNSRKLRLIYENRRKDNRVDALYLARVARLDPKLLAPVQHRDPTAQKGLAIIRSRQTFVATRTHLVNHARGLVKSSGGRLLSCSTESFQKKVLEAIPEALLPGLLPILQTIASVTQRIKYLTPRPVKPS